MRSAALAAGVAATFALLVQPAKAGDAKPFTARAGEDLARSAATAWADDAHLVWVENDEDVSEAGDAARWGYLFYSQSRDAARAYSIEDGEIREANDITFAFPAPPLDATWIDSAQALAAAEDEAGAKFRRENAGRVRSMCLVRGVLRPDAPDDPTWAVVYESAQVPGLWVVVDATTGKVVRTWRG